MILAIDPGVSTGWACFYDELYQHGQLACCGLGFHERIHRVSAVIIEHPVIYPRHTKNPNDIVKLAIDAGRWAGRLEIVASRIVFVKPHEWKGSVPKNIHQKRILSKLTEKEKQIVSGVKTPASLRHNMVDAIGLGLHYLGR